MPVSLALLGLATATSIGRAQGAPTIVDGRYYADNHGQLIPLTRHRYEVELGEWQRGFAAVAGVFFVSSVVLIFGEPETPIGGQDSDGND